MPGQADCQACGFCLAKVVLNLSRKTVKTCRTIGGLLSEMCTSWVAHKAPRMGAALSYYTAFSLAPLLVLTLSIARLFWKHGDASTRIADQFGRLIGTQASAAVQEILAHAGSNRIAWGGTGISLLVLLFASSTAFGEMQDSLNEIWDVPPRKKPYLAMIKERALSFAMVFILGFFMLVSLLSSALIAGLNDALSEALHIQISKAHLEIINTSISLIVFLPLFATIFRILPDVPLTWRDVWPGAIFSTVLFIIGKLLLGWYIGESSTFSAYGAAGSFAIILLWVYYSAQILYLGAEFTRAYTKRYGSQGARKAALG